MLGLNTKYFVLSPTKDDAYGQASRQAMLEYAIFIEHANPALAKDLRAWVAEIRRPKI